MARSLVPPLRRLRTEALSIAGRRLPETVQRCARAATTAAPWRSSPPSAWSSHDEIGEVARAFDEVHREAVRLAGQEATLRSNVNAMFVNLSRRSQTLVERQLSLIESLEQGEQDESRLGNLFRLDHLATRMRRNSENLLVLAGQEPAAPLEPARPADRRGPRLPLRGRELRARRAAGPDRRLRRRHRPSTTSSTCSPSWSRTPSPSRRARPR